MSTNDLTCFVRSLLVVTVVLFSMSAVCAGEGETNPAPATRLELPGLVIDMEQKYVDVSSTVCLVQGALELIACTKGTKEHESIIFINAKPSHMHAALLAIGIQPGNPARMERVGPNAEFYRDIPPMGDRVIVSLVLTNDEGTGVEYPIKKFLKYVDHDDEHLEPQPADPANPVDEKPTFPEFFIFTGSYLIEPPENSDAPSRYLSEESGNVISVSTFGDETLGLATVHSKQNGALGWHVDGKELLKVGQKVMLRLRPENKVPELLKPPTQPKANPDK